MEMIIVFIFGAIIGSFLNVCIYRIPRHESIIYPRSYCDSCKRSIQWFDNISLLSFLFLKGRCRYCKKRISIRYFIVELITAFAGVGLLGYFSLNSQFFVYWLFVCILIVVTFIDIEHKEIPDVISIPGVFIGLIASAFFSSGSAGFSATALADSFSGVLAGGASIYFMGFVGEKLFPKQSKEAGGAVGEGDLKLMAAIGAFLGWKLVFLTFFLAPVAGLGFGLYILLIKKEEVIPYGAFLSFGAVTSLLYGDVILKYLFG